MSGNLKNTRPRKAADFLNSIGVNSSISARSETLEQTILCAKYTGIRWFHTGYEGGIRTEDLIRLNAETGAKISYGLLSGGSDTDKLIQGAETVNVLNNVTSFTYTLSDYPIIFEVVG